MTATRKKMSSSGKELFIYLIAHDTVNDI